MRSPFIVLLGASVAIAVTSACSKGLVNDTALGDGGTLDDTGAPHDGSSGDGPVLGRDGSPADTGTGLDSGQPEDSSTSQDSGVDTGRESDSGTADSSSPQDSGTPGDSGTADCGSFPTLHPESMPGVYCPFSGNPSITCMAYQECCETPAGAGSPSTCEMFGSTCPVANSITWECEDPIACMGNPGAAGPVCCGQGSVQLDSNCGYHYGSGFMGTVCAASCAAGEVTICETQSECPSGTTCTPFKTKGLQIGACL